VVTSLSPTLGAAITDQLADLALTVGVTAATASQAAPAAPTGDYALADASLSFRSPAVAGLAGAINTQVAGVQATVDGLAGQIETALGGINLTGVLTVTADVDAPDLSADISPLLTAPLTDPAYPGVSLNLSTGVVEVDLAEITTLEGLAPNTDLLTAAVINSITSSISGLVGALLSEVEGILTETTNGIKVEATVRLAGLTIVGVNSSVGALLAGDTSGIELFGLGLTIPGGLGAVLGLLLGPLTHLDNLISEITAVVLAPITNALVPAVKPVLDAAVGLTVNNQSTTAGVFTETALRAEVLPGLNALQLDIANASVGPNVVADLPPTVTSIAPSTGPVMGGTVVVITGSGFTDATGVTFGGTAGTSFTVDSDTQITVTTPPGTEGDVDVIVQSPAGDSTPATFTYTAVAAPVVTSVSPAFGPTAGGTTVTITGTGLTGATGATFDGVDGTDFTVVNDTTATVVTPAHAVGTVDVIVAGLAGNATMTDGFTYVAPPDPPVVTGLSPEQGPAAGGTTVTLTGSGFTGATGVTFDGVAGTDLTVVSDTTATVVTPAHAPGVVDVVVTGPGGVGTLADGFEFLAAPAPTSLSPNVGPVAGGTTVTITGTGLTGATGASFDGVAGTDFTVVSDTTATVVTPAHAAGTVDVVVTGPGGAGTVTDGFTFVAAPTVSTLDPDAGPVTGGTTVTVTGAGLLGATEVTFDGIPGTGLTVVSDTSLTVVTPAHATGAVDVVVTTPGGAATLADGFTYMAAPDLSSLSPAEGPTSGGTTVTLTGTNLAGATGVTFDGVAGTDVTVVSDTTVTVVTPAHAAGTVDVVVTSPGGSDTLADAFTYRAAPELTSIDPTAGPLAGGTTVTLTGSGFTGATGVTFDGVAGSDFTVVSDTTATVVTPAHAAGTVDVGIVSPGGSDTLADAFTYRAAPDLASIDPTSGPLTGGTTVTLTGSGFTGATGVTFDGVAGSDFTVVSDTTATVVTPAHTAGAVDVVLTAPGGSDTLTDGFTYMAAPEITSLSPDEGPTVGGTTVTITGTNLTGATGATFDGIAGISFTVVSDTTATVVTPAHAEGTVDVGIVSPGGSDTLADAFTYRAAPELTSIDPTAGPLAGGTTVTLTGSGFTGATGVTFDGVAGSDFTVVSDTTATVVTPAHTAGAVDVVITGPGGSGTLADGFTYLAAPALTSVDPSSGSTAGGTTVTLSGSGFTGTTGVTFDGIAGADFAVVSDTTATVVTPAHAAGAVDVVITGPGGSDTLTDGYTYVTPPPSITSLSPTSGPTAGGTVVTITGTGFTDATGVTFDGAAGTSFTVDSDTQITVTTPAGSAGAADVVILSPHGDSSPGSFTYISPDAPTITGVTPGSGPMTGGTAVTITGTGFDDATGVTFSGLPGTSFSVVDDSTIVVTTPPGVAGPADVVVQSTNGDSAPGTFTYVAAPLVTSISPTMGSTAGGTTVTITGVDFTGATGVDFGGTPATSFTVDSDTTITATTPAHAAGLVNVTVTTAGGTSLPLFFTYVAPPTATSLSPDSGPTAGGTPVAIVGDSLVDVTAVTFDGNPAVIVSTGPFSVDVLTPPGVAGVVDVVVETEYGQSAPLEFLYIGTGPAPAISAIAPPSGPLAGGTEVTITGTDFTGATGVTFDGAAGTVFTVVSDTEITVTTPAGSAGPADVVVLSPNGASTPGTFTYLAPPVIDGISPATGPVSGGTEVTITGSGFTGATGVTFDGVPGTGFTVIDDTTIRVTTPPGTAGTADVVIVSPMGNSTAAAFTYVAEGGGAGGGTGGGDDLPVTGGDLGGMALLALLALLPLTAGVALMRRARRMAA